MQFFSLQLLESCANPSGSKTNIRIEASSEIRTELYKALREVMDIARQGRSQVKSGFFPNILDMPEATKMGIGRTVRSDNLSSDRHQILQ